MATKLFLPAPRAARERLITQLAEGACLPLTLIAAPAGFGKTTLAGEWARRHGVRTAWVSLDEGDNDPVRFWTYVVTALHQADERVGAGALAMLRSPQPPQLHVLLSALIADLAACDGRMALVLDDYHLITARPIHDGMISLLEHLPEQLRVVVLTRADPPFPLARLRVRGQLTEIRVDDLRFTPAETAAFFAGMPLSAEEIRTLDRRIEGWAAALQLAAVALKGQSRPGELVAGFTGQHHFVLDYVMEEVLRGLPAHVQEFLLQTSILERLTGSLCDALTGRADGEELLESLTRENLFLVPLDSERRWYRYHHLFADVLKARLRRRGQAVPADLHARAARWYGANGLPAAAVAHAFAAGEPALAASLIERCAIAMLTNGELATLLGWIGALPESVVAARPWLAVARAWALTLTGRHDEVDPSLAELAAQTDDRLTGGHVAALRAYGAATRGDAGAARALAREALQLLPPDETTVRPVVGFVLGGLAHRAGDLAEAAQAFAEAANAGGETHLGISARSALGGLRVLQGRLHEAADLFRQAAASPLPAAGNALARLGDLHREWNELDKARDLTARGLQQSREGAHIDAAVSRQISLARVCLAQGNPAEAAAVLKEAEQRAQGVSPPVLGDLEACRVSLWLARGDLEAAEAWAAPPFERAQVARGRVLVALGRPAEAAALLATLAGQAEAAGRHGVLVEILAAQAVALHRSGDGAGAQATLARALRLGEPEGYVRTFLDEGAAMTELLRTGVAGAPKPYVERLLGAAGTGVTTPVSPREQEILQLIAAGLTNEEIAARLFLSVLTVKRHISNLYAKLGVTRRTQALALARELGLL